MTADRDLKADGLSVQQREMVSRLRDAISRGGGYKLVVEKSGIPGSSLNGYLNGRDMKTAVAARVAEACGVSLEWLVTGKEAVSVLPPELRDRTVVSLSGEKMPMWDVVTFKKYDVQVSAGDGAVCYAEVPTGYISIPKFLLPENLRVPNDNISSVEVRGDSMSPTLTDGDTLLVDLSVTSIVSGSIYAIRAEDELLVKRLERKINGDLEVVSDNPRYRTQTINAEIARRLWADGDAPIRIIGRVLWRAGSAVA